MRQSRIVRNLSLGVKSLLLHKLRSLLTMLGMVFGVASVIVMLAIIEGASRQALERIRRLGTNNVIVSSHKPSREEGGGTGQEQSNLVIDYGLKYDDHQRITETLPTVVRTVPVRRLPKEAKIEGQSVDVEVVGTTPGWFALVKSRLVAGRALTEYDMDRAATVCVMTEHTVRRLLGNQHVLDQPVMLGDVVFTIVGVVRSESQAAGALSPVKADDVYIPLTTCRGRYGEIIFHNQSGQSSREAVELHQILVEVDAMDQVKPTALMIERLLDRFHDKRDFNVDAPLTLLEQAEQQKREARWTYGSIAAISLLVGGIGIMNIMLATVTERTREIGIRRAIGARKRQIIVQFLVETVVLSTAGGLLGVLGGLLLVGVIDQVFGKPTVVPAVAIVLSLLISVGVGVIFGLYPAIRAANLDPIEALRHE